MFGLMNVKKGSVFWDITPSPLKDNRRFGGTYRLHLQSQRTSQIINMHENVWQTSKQAGSACQLLSRLFFDLFFVPENGCDSFSETPVDFQLTTRHFIPESHIFIHLIQAT
jgi:hypothetical protein